MPPDLDRALRRLSAVSGIAQSSWATQFLAESIPVINAMADAFELAQKDRQAAADLMQNIAQTTMAKAAQAALDLDTTVVQMRRMKGRPQSD